MILKLTQTQLNNDGAHFIISESDQNIGEISFHFKRSGEFRIQLNEENLVMSASPETTESPYHQHMTDPYAISLDHHPVGVIYESTKFDHALTYYEMIYQGDEYALYLTRFSSRDMALNMFCEGEQVAQLEVEENSMKNNKHYNFHIYVKDQPNASKAAICEILYYYMKYCFLQNEEPICKNDEARDYAYSTYNPQFISDFINKSI